MELTEKQKRGRPRKSEALLPGTKKSTVGTELRLYEIADKIVKNGYGRMGCIDYMVKEWGISEKQAEKYYYGALNYLRPENPEKYREALINRNFTVLENLLQTAIERNDIKTAADVVKILNSMLGVGGKQVEIKDKDGSGGDRKIVISFGD